MKTLQPRLPNNDLPYVMYFLLKQMICTDALQVHCNAISASVVHASLFPASSILHECGVLSFLQIPIANSRVVLARNHW